MSLTASLMTTSRMQQCFNVMWILVFTKCFSIPVSLLYSVGNKLTTTTTLHAHKTKSKVQILLKLSKFKFAIFSLNSTPYTPFWSCLIRCINMKLIQLVLWKIQSRHDSVHKWMDVRTYGQTDKVKPVYTPSTSYDDDLVPKHQVFSIKNADLVSNVPPKIHAKILHYILKPDESMACWHLKSPRSPCDRSLDLNLVTKWSWSWPWMTYTHTLCSMSIGPPILRYSYFKIWPLKCLVNTMRMVKGLGNILPWKLKDQGHFQGKTRWSHLRPKVQSICLLFISWQSDHFGLRYSKSHIWPWKSRSRSWPRSNSMVTFEAQSSINRFPFSFVAIGSIFGWDIANSIFDLENSRSRSRQKTIKI